jgi:hypothetical protein
MASGEDQDIQLRRCRRVGRAWHMDVATIHSGGSVWFVFKVPLSHPRADSDGNLHSESTAILANLAENSHALYPPEPPPLSRGRFSKWLYE